MSASPPIPIIIHRNGRGRLREETQILKPKAPLQNSETIWFLCKDYFYKAIFAIPLINCSKQLQKVFISTYPMTNRGHPGFSFSSWPFHPYTLMVLSWSCIEINHVSLNSCIRCCFSRLWSETRISPLCNQFFFGLFVCFCLRFLKISCFIETLLEM